MTRVRRAVDQTCVGCRRRIHRWWFKLGDAQGWWHVHCIVRDEMGGK